MKRGRPSLRFKIYSLIEEYFSLHPYPSNVRKITMFISERLNKKISWNTTKKYLEELVRLDRVKKMETPHSKKANEKGITLYYLETTKR
ncbi:MAG: hypothetical protein QXP34_02345 [Candidatus Aenigmatarchaeota archaeon]